MMHKHYIIMNRQLSCMDNYYAQAIIMHKHYMIRHRELLSIIIIMHGHILCIEYNNAYTITKGV